MAAGVSFDRSTAGYASFDQKGFVTGFFYLSKKCEDESKNKEIIELLKELHSLGFYWSERNVVFGNRLGMSWPCLEKPGITAVAGFAVGCRGASGMGSKSLEQYLQALKAMVNTDQTREKTLVEQPKSSSTSSSGLSERAVKNESGSSSSKSVEREAISRFAALNPLAYEGRPLDLKTIQSMGFLKELPREILNDFTVDDLLGASLSIYEGGLCLLQKTKILAHSPELPIKTPIYEVRGRGMYECIIGGKPSTSDDPCDLHREIAMEEFEDRDELEKILPFLRGLIPYKG